MNCQLAILIVLLIICISKFEKTVESFSGCSGNNCKPTNPEHLHDLTKFSDYQPAAVLTDDVTVNVPKIKCDNTLHHDLCCKNCFWDENGKWSCNQCRKNKPKPQVNSRYLRAMKAMEKIRTSFDSGQIPEYTYHKLFAKWLQTYYDVTLLPKDKVEQLFCSTYLSIIDSAPADTKHLYEDFIYNTWPAKCAKRIPSILFGEVNNVIDVSDPKNMAEPPPKSQNQIDIDELLKDMKDLETSVKKQETVDIGDFRKDFDSLPWKFKEKLPNYGSRQATG